MSIRPLKEYTEQAFKELKKIQSGDKKLPKTGFDFIDSHLGCLLPGDVCLISSPSGTGKTTVAQKIKKNILDKDLNPSADNYLIVDYSLEMKVFNLIMRGTSEVLKVKKSQILFNEFTEEEKIKVKEYYEGLNDDRQFLSQVPPSPEEFYNDCSEFLETHKEKEGIFIVLDHVLLLKGSDKKALLESLCEKINQLKLKYHNVYFLLISQNNRAIYGRIAEKNNLSAPNPTDVFGSSFLDQLCSFNIVLFNPFKAGIMEYMKVNPDRYDYLSDHFTEEDSKGRVSFTTENKIFAHCIKTRESDSPYQDIFVIDMSIDEEQKEKLKLKPKEPSTAIKEMPVFEKEKWPEPNFQIKDAFDGIEDDDSDPPF